MAGSRRPQLDLAVTMDFRLVWGQTALSILHKFTIKQSPTTKGPVTSSLHQFTQMARATSLGTAVCVLRIRPEYSEELEPQNS